jgi:putative serine protease PepD
MSFTRQWLTRPCKWPSRSAGSCVTTPSVTSETAGFSLADIYDMSYKGVVKVTTNQVTTDSFGSEQRQSAQGSGFVYDTDGTVVTNQHVVAGASSIYVQFSNGKTYKAKLVGTDPSTDLAVLQVDAPASLLSPLRLGDSSTLEVGDTVVALGSPFGLQGTMTSGIVSALHRQMTAPNNFTITDTIQTDAAINHGNSGGPLIDLDGRVIGVNAQIESESGGNDGVGFAIPSNTVRSVVTQLLDSGSVQHAYLGIEMLETPDGLAVTKVRSGTPAARAGLKTPTGKTTVDGQDVPTGGDVIVALDGKAITSSAELQSAIDAKRPGDKISLTVVQDGKSRTVEITLASRPS